MDNQVELGLTMDVHTLQPLGQVGRMLVQVGRMLVQVGHTPVLEVGCRMPVLEVGQMLVLEVGCNIDLCLQVELEDSLAMAGECFAGHTLVEDPVDEAQNLKHSKWIDY